MSDTTDHGAPILTLAGKLAALDYCLCDGAYEDVCGHLCDLLLHFGRKIQPSARPPFTTLAELIDVYGKHPAPIEEGP